MFNIEFSDKCKRDLIDGKAYYIRPHEPMKKSFWQRISERKDRVESTGGILHFNGIKIDKTCLALLVDAAVVATFAIPPGTNFERGDTTTFDLADGMMSIKIE